MCDSVSLAARRVSFNGTGNTPGTGGYRNTAAGYHAAATAAAAAGYGAGSAENEKIEWEQSITPLVNQMVHSDGVNQGRTLLVNKVGNKTNSSLQTSVATGALMNTIGKTGVLNVIPAGAVSSAMSVLGMGDNDTLTLRSKAIGLARYLNADYVLYSVVTGTRDARQMEMQLMSVSSGEIIWSGKGAVLEQ
ncbi:penicillin-binding protein activator LpoB [Morganella morganii]|uniref:penicillin-binding protein activator LpoB n=1 Tax=Morganella morganii TaxID=582 RepID=UPI000E04E828|nr:penicillin-binding protein activator LpoB [Morganella morganii]STZ11990.1 Lipoprotein activator of PBP from the outer membrane B [Morganella morganii]STZ16038.1 Lipoprotein activator of PBP from the outer membrane B [Morganella morganii]